MPSHTLNLLSQAPDISTILLDGNTLEPGNGFPISKPWSIYWIIVWNRKTLQQERNFVIDGSIQQGQHQILEALQPFKGNNDYVLTMVIGDENPSGGILPNNEEFAAFLRSAGAGQGMEDWEKDHYFTSTGTGFSYCLTGIIGGGADQGMEQYVSPVQWNPKVKHQTPPAIVKVKFELEGQNGQQLWTPKPQST